ncbi:MAG: TonB-dependent receptor [Gammaproteobacteria bacterium]|nr:TonB-dependent receptor [Gammaproteobacteria bacterium]
MQRAYLRASLVLALLLSAPAVRADEAASAAAAPQQPAAAANSLEEVIVYARRREERLEDTPLAVSARSAAQLQQANVVLLEDIDRDIPNTRMVSSPQSVSALDVTIRGQTVIRSAIMFDPAVGLYVDGVYVANGQGAMATLLDLDSVEVLRGSQGTLFGRDNTGGSILLMTHRPDLQQFSGEVALAGGNYNSFMDRAIVNVPLGSEVALRFAFQGNDRSGFGSSVGSGQDDLMNQHRYQARFGALWRPGETTDFYFTYERFEAHEYGAVLHPLAGPPPGTLVSQIGAAFAQAAIPGLPTVTFPQDPYQTDGSFPAHDNATTDSLQLTATQKLGGDATVKLILGYRHLDADTALDVDATTLPLADTTLYNTSNQKSAEWQLNDKSFDGHLDWVAGVYWFLDKGSAPSVQAPASPEFLAASTQFDQTTGGIPVPCPPQVPPGTPCRLPVTPFFSPLPVYNENSVRNRSTAAYLHGDYQLTPAWAMAAGVRRTDDLRELSENDYVIVPAMPGFPGGQSCTIGGAPPGPCPAVDQSVSYHFWSWEFSTRYRLNESANAYLRIGRSQRSGGWNSPVASLHDEPFKPEQLTDYEIGMKADLFGGALALNGDVFYGKYDDMQRLLAELNASGTPVTLVTNAGQARVSGAELESLWRASSRLSFLLTFGWPDARYQTFLYQPPAPAGVPPPPVEDLSHNEFYQTPRLQGDVGGSYLVPTSIGDLLLRADYMWQDKIEFNVINDFNYQPAYGTANARVALASRARTWELALFANNLADKHYAYTGGTIGTPLSPYPTIAWNIPGARRLAGIEGSYRWNPAH